jgi:nucleoid DNA-binding protein
MTVRSILSARSARPHVEAMLRGLVRAAVYLGRADGQLSEAEVERLIDSVRELVTNEIGAEHVGELANVGRLLDEARAARVALSRGGEAKYLVDLNSCFEAGFRREALIIARRVIAADARIAPGEIAAFGKLSAALGFNAEETAALETMAASTWSEDDEHLEEAIEQVMGFIKRGWHDAFPELKAAGYELRWFDAGVAYTSKVARLRVDLAAQERVVHINVMELNGVGPHIICIYGTGLHAVMSLLDQVKDSVTPATVPELLSDLIGRCDALFLERDGRLVQVHPSAS